MTDREIADAAFASLQQKVNDLDDTVTELEGLVADLRDTHSRHWRHLEPQPKDDGYHALMADVYDLRDRG